MRKTYFKSEEEANAYKEKHKLFGVVAELLNGAGQWGLVYPIKANVTVRNGGPSQAEMQSLN